MLITLAITLLLAKAVLPTKDIAVCVLLHSEVKPMTKINFMTKTGNYEHYHFSFS